MQYACMLISTTAQHAAYADPGLKRHTWVGSCALYSVWKCKMRIAP